MSEITPTSEEPIVAPVSAVQESADATIAEPEAAPAVDMTLPAGEKMLAIIGYIGFFCALPLILKPKSALCQHHGKQALAITLVFFIASNAFLAFTLLTGAIVALYKFTAVIYIAWAVVAIMGMISAKAGKKTNMPFFGMVAKNFTW